MADAQSKGAPAAAAFPLFQQLPTEIRDQIWTFSAKAWAQHYINETTVWTVNEKKVFLLRIWHSVVDINGPKNKLPCTGRCGYVLELPALLFTCIASRNIMYDALLSFDYRDLNFDPDTPNVEYYGNVAPRGDDIHLFLRADVNTNHPNPWDRPKMIGLRIQDFRYPRLSTRVREERERLQRLREEMQEVREKRVVDVETAPEGYVRLPIFGYRSYVKIETTDEQGHHTRYLSPYPDVREGEPRINVLWP